MQAKKYFDLAKSLVQIAPNKNQNINLTLTPKYFLHENSYN